MAGVVRLVFDTSGNITMVVNPDKDNQLLDPAFSPKGVVVVDLPATDYHKSRTPRDHLVLAQPILSSKNLTVASAVSSKIQAIDSAAAQVASLAANPLPYTTVSVNPATL